MIIRTVLISILLLIPLSLAAQLRFNNLMSYQLGNLPYTEPKDYSSFYDQANLNFRYNWLKVFTRFEIFRAENETRNYAKFNQYRFELKHQELQLKAGHFYEMFGRGLLLRAFEIPENIYEDAGYRVRHGFYRDLFGAMIGYSGKNFTIKAIKGKPLINLIPPTQSDDVRRLDDLFGITGTIKSDKLSFSTHYVSNSYERRIESLLSLGVSAGLTQNMDIYLEYAHETRQFLKTGADDRFGMYGSINFFFDRTGISLEYKSYNNFLLGSGYNDPPTLVKEQPYPVLNRRTHVTNLENETGLQFESYFRTSGDDLYTINIAYGTNDLYKKFQYYEIFFQWNTDISSNSRLKLFADYAGDELMNEENRFSLGSVYETPIWSDWHTKIDVQAQNFARILGEQKNIYNGYFSISLIPMTEFTASFIWEITDDHFLTDNPTTQPIETNPRNWYAVNLAYRLSARNRFELFAGQRRGGPSCTSGICFEVLDFEGIEFKWVTRI